MKKILLIGILAISAVSFSSPLNHMQGGGYMMQGRGQHMMQNGGQMQGGRGMMMNMTPEQRAAMEKGMIAMQEKQLEVRKLMNTANPDMKKIERLNAEIGTMRIKQMETMHQSMASQMAPAR